MGEKLELIHRLGESIVPFPEGKAEKIGDYVGSERFRIEHLGYASVLVDRNTLHPVLEYNVDVSPKQEFTVALTVSGKLYYSDTQKGRYHRIWYPAEEMEPQTKRPEVNPNDQNQMQSVRLQVFPGHYKPIPRAHV